MGTKEAPPNLPTRGGLAKKCCMKREMRTRNILLLMGLLLFASSAVAQTRFYDVTRTFHESGFTYQADVRYGSVTLFNRDAGRFTNTRQTFRDGRLISETDRERGDVVRATNRPMMDLAERIVRNTLFGG